MLVLISFGLVLVATVLLVLGLLAGSGLALIYLSMACSVVAGIVLVVATVTRRPSAETTPAPAATGAWAREQETATIGSALSTTTAPVPVQSPPPAYTPATRQPAMASVAASGSASSGDGFDDVFPIEDYDELTIGEILPLLPELYPDELSVVEEHERAGKARVSVLDRIEELRRSPVDDVQERAAAEHAEEPEGDFFPIEDYDDLTVGDIIPLLPELYPEELDEVEAHERAGKGRVSIINRIAELRTEGVPEPEVLTGDDQEVTDEEGFFPIEDYDDLTVGEILPLLPELYADELNEVEDHERATKNRAVILNRLGELRQTAEAGEPDTAVTVPAGGDEEGFFPIEDYDDLTVGEILPLLPELYDDELDEVEDHERATKNRAAVLDRLRELRETPGAEDEAVGTVVEPDLPDEDEGELFPIEDYDELNEGEIIPLLPELYDDELDVVEDRERATKNRGAVLDRLAEVRDTRGLVEVGGVDTVVEPEPPDEEELFPIEDYDELNEGEIIPLLPELYDDELDVVEDRERATKNRAAILDRLSELRASGQPEEAEPAPAVPAGAPDEELFPIAEYDELTEDEILPLLPELYDDELDVVEDRERATKNRPAVLDGLAELRQGPGTTEVVIEPEGDWEVPDEGWAPEAEAPEEDLFPIPDYDRLRVPEIRALLPELSQDELERVRDRELEGANRSMVLAAIYRELGLEAPAPARKATARKGPAKKAPARKAAAKKAPARKAPGRKAGAKKTAAAKKAAAKKAPAKKAPAKKAAAKKAPARKAPAKKVPARKAPAKKVPARKAPAKKAASTRRTTAKKAAPARKGARR